MIEYAWKKKQQKANYFGIVEQAVYELEGVQGGISESAISVTVFPEHEQKHVDEWTQEAIDTCAEECRAKFGMDDEIKRRLSVPSSQWTVESIKSYMNDNNLEYASGDVKNDLLDKIESPPVKELPKQKVIVKEVEKEVSRTEIVEIDGKYVQKTFTETITKQVEEPQWEEVPLYDEDGEQLMRLVSEAIEAKEAVLDEDGNEIEEAVDAQDAVYEGIVHRIPIME